MLSMGIRGTEKVVITGVTGMDGSVMSKYLLSLGYIVIGIKRRTSTENTWRIKEILDHPNFTLVEGDITDIYSIIEILKKHKPQYVLNFAAMSHVGTSFEQPQLTWDVTANGAINVMNACKLVDTNIKIFQASTSEMFGSNYSIKNGEKIQDHDTVIAPNSPYAVSKNSSHDYARVMRESYGMFVCPVILFNHTHTTRGENFVERKITRYVGRFKKWVDETRFCNEDFEGSEFNENISVGNKVLPKLRLGNIESYRDFGWSEDYMEAVWKIMNSKKPEDYIIATGKTYKIKEIIELAFNQIGWGEHWEKLIYIDPAFYRPNEVPYLCGSYEKLKNDLGWEPKHNIEQIITKMVKYDIELAKNE